MAWTCIAKTIRTKPTEAEHRDVGPLFAPHKRTTIRRCWYPQISRCPIENLSSTKRSEGSASNAVRDFLFIFEFVGAPSFPPLEGWELLTFTPANNRASSPTPPNEPVFSVDLRQV